MGRQKISQTKKLHRSQEKELKEIDETKATQIADAEYKILAIGIFKDISGRMNDLSET